MPGKRRKWPAQQQDYPATRKRMIEQSTLFQYQLQREDGGWQDFLSAISDRGAMTRIQVDRNRRFPEERQRVLRYEVRVYLDEVIGDGEGEPTAEELVKRNDEFTDALIEQENQQSSK